MSTHSVTPIGAGKVGTTLGLLLARHGYSIAQIYSRTAASAQRAQALIGQGLIVEKIANLKPTDIILIAVSDSAIAEVASALAEHANITQGTIAFHCSGALSSDLLQPLQKRGASIASLHPVKSFTEPTSDAASFPGTYCALEGESAALETLRLLVEHIGGKAFDIATEHKLLYHAATVMASNYQLALIEAALRCAELAGVSREQAMHMLTPILRETTEKALQLGPQQALTGPIARGDSALVAEQSAALAAKAPELHAIYTALGTLTLDLAGPRLGAEKLAEIRRIFAIHKAGDL